MKQQAILKCENLPPFKYQNEQCELEIKKTGLALFDQESKRVIDEDQDEEPGFYTGQWATNIEPEKSNVPQNRTEMRHGRGTYTWSDGETYEGYWLYDRMHGFGRKIYEDGTVYTGNWLNSMHSGTGKITLANGDVYEGQFAEGDYDGEGVQTLASNGGGHYTGQFSRGLKHGEGDF